MEAFESRLQSFTKARRVKQSTAKRTASLKWPHPAHFVATPDTLTEAGFFFNPSWDARDNVECFCCGKCLAGWEENDDPFALHWDRCRDTCPWAAVRCGLSDDVDRKGNFVFKDSSRQPEGKPMEKARLATFRLNNPWPHDRVKGHGANSTKMAKAGFAFTPQIPGDDTGTCLYCRVSLNGWDEDDDPLASQTSKKV
ncbi:inhibitor of apoptosis repeat-containing protein [Russula ochroleuca]|uniref:Inhibitor of apoptosis repeat-containing protein n=1 Tax=Russula ochroleuca TaxID=152965 RepID=A0A9P5T9G8_9AGAM|nr:inhibitor of apoptosis repeat-containing protein [Russula ochroleuca]